MRQLLFLCTVLVSGLVSVRVYAQPANDACAGAITVTPNGSCVTGTTAAATDGWIGTVGCAGNNPEVWYSFTATGSQLDVNITNGTLGGNVEFILVEALAPCVGLTLYASICAPSPVNQTLSLSLTPGNLYYYTISGTGAAGTFTACVNSYNAPPAPGFDCTTAEALCNGASFSQGTFSGIGATENVSTNGCFGLNERQSKWYTFTCSQSGTFQLLINPTNYNAVTQTGDDFDFSLWDVTTGCYVSALTLGPPITCNWSGCTGSTGVAPAAPFMGQLAVTDYQANNPAGPGDCLSNQQWNTAAVNLVACRRYALLIDNYTSSSGGFAVTFGGTAVLGPNALFTTSLSTNCYTVTVNRGTLCTTTAMGYTWNFGNGTTSTAGVPAPLTYATPGLYTISLIVTDANGCVDAYSTSVNIGCVLPVELVGFEARPTDHAVHCAWSTASELNNDRFEVERSRDGVAFELVGIVPGAGNSTTTLNYALDDPRPYQGLSYYRLCQVDMDGTRTYSEIAMVTFEDAIGDPLVTPMPVTGPGVVTVPASSDGELRLEVVDLNGRLVMAADHVVQRGMNAIPFALPALPAGIYALRLSMGGSVRTVRLII
jgi:PKD repeat protein